MKNNPDLAQSKCFNCGTSIKGTFCHHCGQRARDNTDRSLSRLIGEVLSNIFFLDNRFLISVGYLIRFPGRMTVEFLEGKRKKFISPVTLFLFFNLIYFLASPLTDYSINYYDQVYSQPYSGLIKDWVEFRMQKEGLKEQTYAITYQNASDNISKSIMILNVPMIAFFVYLIAFKRRQFYFDNLIFTFHFFSFFMFSWVMLGCVGSLFDFVGVDEESVVSNIVFVLFTYVVPIVYAILSVKKFMNIRWYWAIPAGLGVVFAVGLSNIIYRFIIFMITFSVT